MSAIFLPRFVRPTDVEIIPHALTPTSIIPTKFEVDRTIHCRVIAFLSADTWLCDLDFWPFDLEQLWVIMFPVGYHWECVRGHCACAESRNPWVGGQKQLHFWNPRPWFAYSLCTFDSTINVIKVICENNARPCVTRRTSFCACAKSRDLLKVP